MRLNGPNQLRRANTTPAAPVYNHYPNLPVIGAMTMSKMYSK